MGDVKKDENHKSEREITVFSPSLLPNERFHWGMKMEFHFPHFGLAKRTPKESTSKEKEKQRSQNI